MTDVGEDDDVKERQAMKNITKITLAEEEAGEIREQVAELARRYESAEDEEFLRRAPYYAFRLPRRVCDFVRDFGLDEPPETVCVVSGYPIDEEKVGPTPAHWMDAHRQRPRPTVDEEMLLVLLGSLLGECIGWATQQEGRIVHDIAPIQGHENEQLGSGSEQLLWWHTEDAFHPCRGDYVGMLCLRNPDGVPTTIGSLNGCSLEKEQLEQLFQEQYTIRPDESHLPKNRVSEEPGDERLAAAYDRMMNINSGPHRVSVMEGSMDAPYLRLDPYFMDRVEDRPEAWSAFKSLVELLDESMEEMVLEPGEICFVDNFRAVHGRKPFKAHHDGRDRWLKRVNVTRDLRKSRALRRSASDRVIY